MRRLTLLTLSLSLCLISLAIVSPGVQAQTAPVLSNLEIEFWPEYDQPSVLVIYRGTLSASTALPATLTFRYPASLGNPLAVAQSSNGQLLNLEYSTQTLGQDLLVTFSTPSADFQFEYYDTALDTSTAKRKYTFQSIAPYAVETLNFKAQHPLEASNITFNPALPDVQTGSDGLTYSGAAVSGVTAGQNISLEIQYTKTSSGLTANNISSAPAVVSTPTPTTPKTDPLLIGIIVAGAAGALFIGWGVWGYFRPPSTRQATRAPRPRKHGETSSIPSDTETTFCHKCGTRAQGGDEFCRNCGTRLRRNE